MSESDRPGLHQSREPPLEDQHGRGASNGSLHTRDNVSSSHDQDSDATNASSIQLERQNRNLWNSEFGFVELFSPWFPNVDPAYYEAKGIRSWRIWHSKRSRVLWSAFASSTFVLIANIVLVAVLGAKYGILSKRGLIRLYQGDCDTVKRIGIASHVGINVLSTLLLGASNLCMQLLVAPTREEVDAAHRKKIWLDIGIPSWKNIKNIKPSRRWLFFSLMLSSIPLHFM